MIIHSGPAQVIAHGTVTSFAGEGLRFDQVAGRTLSVTFADDPDDLQPAASSELTDDGLALTLSHFTDGRGSAEPVLIGPVADGLLFLHFRVWRHGRSVDHTMHYTFFVVQPEALGWEAWSEADPGASEG